jgi:GrpB-like predicted nucleotidyltransferase (UPF0157 family)
MLPEPGSVPTPGPPALVPYDPTWPERFARYRDAILEVCGTWVSHIEHIGSTAVPGLGAKDVIDMMPALRHHDLGPRCAEPLAALGFEYLGAYGLERRHFFRRMKDCHLHMYAPGEGQWDDQLAFRDYLRAHPSVRDAYWLLKQRLAGEHRTIDAYAEAKTGFVQDVLRRAREGR